MYNVQCTHVFNIYHVQSARFSCLFLNETLEEEEEIFTIQSWRKWNSVLQYYYMTVIKWYLVVSVQYLKSMECGQLKVKTTSSVTIHYTTPYISQKQCTIYMLQGQYSVLLTHNQVSMLFRFPLQLYYCLIALPNNWNG